MTDRLDPRVVAHCRELLDDAGLDPDGAERQCRVCGCTDELACPDGCEWVEADLCSNCRNRDAN